MISGIYSITNIITGKIYIGSAQNLNKRKTQHFSNLKYNRHTNKYLQSSYNKHGKNCFIFKVIEIITNIEDLITYEQKWINLTKCYDRKFGYNQCKIADRPMIGKKLTPEHILIIKNSNTGENNHWWGKTFSEEHKNKLKESRKLQIMTNNKIIIQYNLDDTFVKEWNSSHEIAKKLGYSQGLISQCCNGKRNKHKGFKWKFK